jgi:hypothetical protein
VHVDNGGSDKRSPPLHPPSPLRGGCPSQWMRISPRREKHRSRITASKPKLDAWPWRCAPKNRRRIGAPAEVLGSSARRGPADRTLRARDPYRSPSCLGLASSPSDNLRDKVRIPGSPVTQPPPLPAPTSAETYGQVLLSSQDPTPTRWPRLWQRQRGTGQTRHCDGGIRLTRTRRSRNHRMRP